RSPPVDPPLTTTATSNQSTHTTSRTDPCPARLGQTAPATVTRRTRTSFDGRRGDHPSALNLSANITLPFRDRPASAAVVKMRVHPGQLLVRPRFRVAKTLPI